MDLRELELMSAEVAARRLIGCELIRTFPEGRARLRIVETEAYDESDAASHSYSGRTKRTDIMFGPAGYLYVYFTYGMHYCMNVVVGKEGYGAAVLIRAVEPIIGESLLTARRSKAGVELTNGPAKVCQALGVNKTMNGHDLAQPPLELLLRKPLNHASVQVTKRIGIRKATDTLWRFCEVGNSYLSRR